MEKIDQYIKQYKKSLNKDIKNELKSLKSKRKETGKLKKVKKQVESEYKKNRIYLIFKNIFSKFSRYILSKSIQIINALKKELPVLAKKIWILFSNAVYKFIKILPRVRYGMKITADYLKPRLKKIMRFIFIRKYTSYILGCLIFMFLSINIIKINSYTVIKPYIVREAYGYYVYIDDLNIGLIDKKETFYNIKEELGEEYSWFSDDSEIDNLISFKVNIKDFIRPSKKEFENNLKELLKNYNRAWSIYVEGEKIVSLSSRWESEYVLDKIIEHFKPVQKEDEIIENVSLDFIENTEIKLSFDKSDDILSTNEALNYLLKGTTEDKIYEVTNGDTVWDIAIKYDMPVSDIQKANPDKNLSAVYIGDLLNLTVPKPYLNIDINFKHTYKEGIPYTTRIIRDDTLYRTEYRLEQSGIYGKKEISAIEYYKNNEKIDAEILNEQILSYPRIRIVRIGTLRTPDDVLMSSFMLPSDTGIITSKFGPRNGSLHTGIDLAIPVGTPVFSYKAGTVIFTGRKYGYGKLIIVQHADDIVTYYAHLSEIQVSPGDYVSGKQQIALSGNTGYSTGPHIHFEIRVNGKVTDPLEYVKQPVYSAGITSDESNNMASEGSEIENETLGIGPMEQ